MDFTEKHSLGTGTSHQLQETTSPSNLVLGTSGWLVQRGAEKLLAWSGQGDRSKYTHCGKTKIPLGGIWKTAVPMRAMTKGLRLDVCKKDRDRGLNVPKVMALTRLQSS